MLKRLRASARWSLTILLALATTGVSAQWAATALVRNDHSGPYNVTILEGGEGLTQRPRYTAVICSRSCPSSREIVSRA